MIIKYLLNNRPIYLEFKLIILTRINLKIVKHATIHLLFLHAQESCGDVLEIGNKINFRI